MRGGRKIIEQIDWAIQVNDRLLLVLSDDSMASNWVQTEIKRARTVERREQRQKLFPIRLASMRNESLNLTGRGNSKRRPPIFGRMSRTPNA